jgi:hypothetical protein
MRSPSDEAPFAQFTNGEGFTCFWYLNCPPQDHVEGGDVTSPDP